MFERPQKYLFFLIAFFLSSQFGLHFWPRFAFVNGARIDYLSPTLYLLDVLIILFIFVSALKDKKIFRFKEKSSIFPVTTLKLLFLIFFLDLIINIFISKSPLAHFFGILKIVEFGFFGWVVAKTFKKEDIPNFVYALSFSALVSSILAIWQFMIQSSVGGIWYFLGERTFNTSTIGISTVNLNQQILRPYAAFPHPNILAFFLLMSIFFSVHSILHEKKLPLKIFLILSILLSSIALVLTFSRIVIMLAIMVAIGELYTKGKRNIKYIVPVFLSLLIFLYILLPQIFASQFLFRGLDFRQELFLESFTIFKNNPYFGIGLNNFFINQAPLIKIISPTNFQPIHNIFALALLSLGLFGFWIFPAAFVLAFRSLTNKLRTPNYELRTFYKCILFTLISVIIVGLFDHFFLTLEQGEIIFALILGLTFAQLG